MAPTREVEQPPDYQGTTNGGASCDHSYRTIGFEPDDANQKHPLFLYFVGTLFNPDDQGARFDARASLEVTEAMARRGFVALSAEYDNGFSLQFTSKMACMFGDSNAASLIARACALKNVDCTLGIATWGHSQGALVAHAAANLDARVRAVWATGYGGFEGAALPVQRLRVVNGERDTMNSSVATLNKMTGFSAAECPDDGRDRCLRGDGSGWILVRESASQENAADHCWFNKRSCAENGENLEPNWVDPTSGAPFALEANADWVADTIARPGD